MGYGHEADQIFHTILEGRPNGMPAFRGKIPDKQIWQLAAYVRSMSGLVPKDVAPSRDDHMSGNPPESSTTRQQPKNAGAAAIGGAVMGGPARVLQSVLGPAGPQAAHIAGSGG